MEIPGLEPLPGGMSGETWVSEVAGERTVVRLYAGRSRARGLDASEVDAAVLRWVRGLVPVPDVLEVRRGDQDADLPALLVTSFLPGVLLEHVLPDLDDGALARVGDSLGRLLARLAGVALPRPGLFRGPDLAIEPFPLADVGDWVTDQVPRLVGWTSEEVAGLLTVAGSAPDGPSRSVLVHGDLNPKNLLVDPDSLAVTGVLDWEFAHSGSPYADLGNLVRFDRSPAYVEAVLAAREAGVPDPRDDALDLARATDLVALVDLATRAEENPVAARAERLLRAIATTRDLHAEP